MVKRTRSLPLNTIILAIIAIAVVVFLIGNFILPPNQPTPPTPPTPSSNQKNFALCLEYATAIDTQMDTYTNSSTQLQMLANSQYILSNCSIYFQYSFTLYNGSEVECGLGPNYCINLNNGESQSSQSGGSQTGGPSSSSTGTSSNCNKCTPPSCIPGCELK